MHCSKTHTVATALFARYGNTRITTRHPFAIYVWVEITGRLLMGSYKLLPQFLGTSYFHYLMEELHQLLEVLPLAM
jgi:hypothetical protein